MTIIIEDGSIVENANSLSTVSELVAWAGIRGKTIPTEEADQIALLILAMDYITSKESKLKGSRVSALQTLPYPRVNIGLVNGFAVASNVIHANAKQAQLELSIMAHESSLFVDEQVSNIASEKIGPMTTSYFDSGGWKQVRTDSADTYLLPLMKNNGVVSGEMERR